MLPWLIHGYEGAVDRLSQAMDLPQETARDVSIAAFEAANGSP
jgi:hypothetical protein